jgi:hypothetical protein
MSFSPRDGHLSDVYPLSQDGATQLHNSAALRRTIAHSAAAVMPRLIWREQYSYIIMVWVCVSLVRVNNCQQEDNQRHTIIRRCDE